MDFIFNVRKAVAAAEYLCEKAGRSVDLLCLVKMLYTADRMALTRWQRSITGDRLVSMNNGPVVSRLYDLMRYKASGSDMAAWATSFEPRLDNSIRLKPAVVPNLDPLSQREEEVLDEAFDFIMTLRENNEGRKFIQALHDAFPEWEDPRGSSIMIDPASILRFDMDEDQIKAIEQELVSHESARIAFS